MKNTLTFWGSGKLRRSDIFVVPHLSEIISPVGATYSGPFSDNAAPERSLDFLWNEGSKNMSALTGLTPATNPFCQFSLNLCVAPRIACISTGRISVNSRNSRKVLKNPQACPRRSNPFQGVPRCPKPFQAFSQKKKIVLFFGLVVWSLSVLGDSTQINPGESKSGAEADQCRPKT